MAKIKTGLNYFSIDTNRYQDTKIKRLKRKYGCEGLAVYDYILCEIYRDKGCYLDWTEDAIFDVSEYLALAEDAVKEIASFCAFVGLFDVDKLSAGIVTSRSIQERYLDFCSRAKRKNAVIPENIKLPEECEIIPEECEIIPEECEIIPENIKLPEECEIIPEECEIIPEECEIIPENSGSLPRKEVKKSKVKESKYNPPQERLIYNNSNTRERGGGQIKDIYGELCKKCPERADVWEAAAISNSFQNKFTEYYTQWLQLTDEQRAGYQLYQLNTVLRKESGDVNLEWYNALYWCKDNLLQTQFCEIYTRLTAKPAALSDLTKLIKEVGKGKINNPGLFILSRLR